MSESDKCIVGISFYRFLSTTPGFLIPGLGDKVACEQASRKDGEKLRRARNRTTREAIVLGPGACLLVSSLAVSSSVT